ncbi:MAG: DUF547 domain-containing protein [Sedimentisphaerales bacterium]|nr:DUF547 domain-containing protein [Sedimentisphaerales bacterium]
MRNNYRFFMLTGFFIMSFVFSSQTLAVESEKQGFDYSDFADALKINVDDVGMVNYRKLKAEPQKLRTFITELENLDRKDFDEWDDNEKIAFWLNAYNALTLKAIIDNYPIKSSFFKSRIYPQNSIRQIAGVWDKIKFNVMGQNLTLEHIEHKILRVKFDEPGIHMAMVCAAMGCPSLRNEPYTGNKLIEQLDDQARRFLANPEKFKIARTDSRIYLSPIFKWFAADFIKKHGPEKNIGRHNKEESAVLNFIASYLDKVQKEYVLTGKFKIKYLKYDWSLNEQQTTK